MGLASNNGDLMVGNGLYGRHLLDYFGTLGGLEALNISHSDNDDDMTAYQYGDCTILYLRNLGHS